MMFLISCYFITDKVGQLTLGVYSLIFIIFTLISIFFEKRANRLTKEIELLQHENDVKKFKGITSQLDILIELMRKNKRRKHNENKK